MITRTGAESGASAARIDALGESGISNALRAVECLPSGTHRLPATPKFVQAGFSPKD